MTISIQTISYAYPGGANALTHVSLELLPGSITALMGTNGAGKTTLAKHLNGLLLPDEGRVCLGRHDTRQLDAVQLAAHTAYMFQNPDDQLFAASVDRELCFGPQNLGYDETKTRKLVDTALDLTGLESMARTNPGDLPQNKKRLCCLAGVLAMDARCYILDEPTQGLDRYDTRRVIDILHYLKDRNKTIVLITHDLDFAAEQATDGIVLHQGQVAAHDTLDAIFSNPEQCRQWGLFLPQTVRLGLALNMTPPPLTPAGLVFRLSEREKNLNKIEN